MRDSMSLQNKIFKIIIVMVVSLSVISILENIFIGLSYKANIKWIFIGIISLFAIYYQDTIFVSGYFRLFYALIIIIGLLPIGWINSGGSNNITFAYIFLVLICITFLFHSTTRNILVVLLIAMIMTLLCLEYYYPEIIQAIGRKTYFLDHLLQTPLTLIGGYLLLRQFSDAYSEEKEVLRIYSKELLEANRKLEFMANRDPLTMVYNRRVFDAKLLEIVEQKEHYDDPIHIVLIDIDSFKKINDTYGHSIGDKIICDVADSINRTVPKDSFVSRWGGDEFAIIFFESLDKVILYVNELQKNVRDIIIDDGQIITISVGITQIKETDDMKEVFKRVDANLYQSKSRGKDQYTAT